MSNTAKRLQSVDVAKGLLMIAICCLHIGNEAMPWTALLRVHVGVYFILSGYFYKPNQGYLQNLKRRARQILVPFVLYGAVALLAVFAFENLRGEPVSIAHLANAFYRSVMDNWCMQPIGAHVTDGTIALYVLPMWFLGRLFVSELILFAVADWALKSIRRMAITIAALLSITFMWGALVGIHLPMQINTCFAIAAIMLAGAYARQKRVAEYIEQGWRRPKYWGIALTMAAIFAGLMQTGAGEAKLVKGFFSTVQNTSQMWTVFPWFALVLCGAYLMLVLCTFIAKIPLVRPLLQRIGQSTLMILCCHQPLAYILLTGMGIDLFLARGVQPTNLAARIGAIALSIAIGILLTQGKTRLDNRLRQRRKTDTIA